MCDICKGTIELSPYTSCSCIVNSGYRLTQCNFDKRCQKAAIVTRSGQWMWVIVWNINIGGQTFWVDAFKHQGDKIIVTAKYKTAPLCDTVSACTNVAVLFCVIL
jgi:hypothetical protein